MTTDPILGDLLRVHIDVLVELVDSPKTSADVKNALDNAREEPPCRSRVYQIVNELEEAGLVAESGSGAYHNATLYEATEDGEVRAKEYVAHLGSRLFD